MSKKPNQNSLRTLTEGTPEAEKTLETSNRFFSTLAKISPVGIFRTDAQGNCVYVSESWCGIAGMAQNDALGGGWAQAIHLDDREQVVQAWNTSAQIHQNFNREYRFQQLNGITRWVLGQAVTEWDPAGKLIGYVGTITDITARKQVEEALRESEARYRYLFQSNPHPMWIYNMETLRFLAVNNAAIAHYGYSMDEFLAMTIKDIRPPEDIQPLLEELSRLGNANINMSWIWRHIKKDGTPIDVGITSHKLSFGGSDAKLVLINDITERKHAEERIQHLAHFDSLTGLPNRSLLGDRVSQAICMAQRNRDSLAVLFIDLDHFKNINDTLGHHIGDGLLTGIAKRLKSVVRDEDTVARLGGDEFVLLLPGTDADGAAHVAEKLLETATKHYQIEHYELVITTSIGIAIYPSDGMDFDNLTRCADVAMYRAKRDGRNNFRFFTAEMQASSARNLQLGNALRRALEHNQLQLHYQPQASIENGCVIGVEALLRWQHPELGMISPAEFIPIAEDSGLILPIGEWVLRTAVRQLKIWMDTGIAPMIIAVNLSMVQFRQPQLLKLVTQILKDEGLPPKYLELELTESVTMNDPLTAITVMNNLHKHGVRMSIDDFGTGYSSLSYLKRFNVYKLKIDQSFVHDIAENLENKTIFKAIINLAKGLGLRTIAEGVETQEQVEFLRENGCDEIQGYHYSKPLPVDLFEAFVRKKN
ncbi:MAG: PAS domain S-box-containing protein/diguanylate cyclase (GGDEF) domain-containing protein [Candidatus Nitrotoga sp. SPKER]|nr:MAG: PAS domain S-box-containing protein/diguanylate cyclase (GGDEF) domain-containing protein [Candidatus Nitrotoga sp. SPKER]